MDQPSGDVLIITEKDLLIDKNSLPQFCNAKTKKGNICKNKSYNNGKYCKLHYKQFSLEKPDDCPVCMESLEKVDCPLKCGHWIHRDCLMKWKEDTCPMCRAKIKFTSEEKRLKNRIHKRENPSDDEVILPPEIIELLESLLRGVPEYMREEFIAGFLHVDIENNSIVIGNDNFEREEFSAQEIEDFPDIIEE